MPEVLTRVDEGDGASTMEFDAEGARKYHIEHERLRAAVVEAAKAWRKRRLNLDTLALDPIEKMDLHMAANSDVFAVVDALIAFEAEHKIGEGKC
jgi:hypothetical protein